MATSSGVPAGSASAAASPAVTGPADAGSGVPSGSTSLAGVPDSRMTFASPAPMARGAGLVPHDPIPTARSPRPAPLRPAMAAASIMRAAWEAAFSSASATPNASIPKACRSCARERMVPSARCSAAMAATGERLPPARHESR